LTPGAAGRTISFSTIELNNPFKSTPNLVPVGSAVTGNDGSFEFTGWTPPKSKTGYLLFPQYKAQPGDLLPSTMCPIYYSPRNGFLAGFY
jgi:hypothetical protein